MNMPFNTMIIDREPFLLIERACVSISGKSVVAKRKEGNFNIPVSSINCLMLGNGTSITSEAATICAKHNCYIAFAKGGSNIHSIWHSGRYQNPKKLVRQIEKHSNSVIRLETAKLITLKRLSYLEEPFSSFLAPERIQKCETIEELLGVEGAFTKKLYLELSGASFKRNANSKEGIDGRISLLNNALYNFVTSIILPLGYHPSIGFLHGQTRRGGLTFDIADIFKFPLCTKEAFSEKHEDGQLLRILSKKLTDHRKYWTREIIDSVEELLC